FEIKERKELKIKIIFNGKTPENQKKFLIMGEELLCYSMLGNLIKNALEASPERETVTIMLNNEKDCVIRIHNKGSVPKDIHDNFFDKYVTSNKNSGTGLGTYSAKLTAETHNGSIHMQSSEQDGTVITISFPDAESYHRAEFNNLNQNNLNRENLNQNNINQKRESQNNTEAVFSQPQNHIFLSLAEVISNINKMLHFLEIGDTQAEEYLYILKQNIYNSDMGNKVELLEQQIQNYDFDAACKMLLDIRKNFEKQNDFPITT
ncbi:ATP-binding protein, partial [Desulfobacterales bacterium HSG17]|nr:ATP-binding protein [Desulfobacterales bacterium HSG17]